MAHSHLARSPHPARSFARLQDFVLLLAVASLVISLAGRTFSHRSNTSKSIRSGHVDPKRQHLERDSATYGVVVARFIAPLWAQVSAEVPAACEPLVSSHPDSCLFTRPPPSY